MRRFAIFNKKKKKKEEEADGQGNENEVVKVEEDGAESPESPESTESLEGSKKSTSNIDLKSILGLIVVGVIAVGTAFIYVTKIYSSKDAYNITDQVAAADVKDGLKVDSEMVEVSEKGESGGKDGIEGSKDGGGGDQKSSSVLDKILVPMESIVVNLGKVESKRYLRVIISLEVNNSEAEQTIKGNMVVFRDKLISYLSSKGIDEISTQDSQLKLRTNIKDILNKELLGADDTITQVYFSDFIIQ